MSQHIDRDQVQATQETSSQQAELQTSAKPKLRVQVKSQPAAQPLTQPQLNSQKKAQTNTNTQNQTQSQNKPKLKVQDKSQFQPQHQSHPQPNPKPILAPKPVPALTPTPKPTPEPIPEPIPVHEEEPCRTITIDRATHAYKEWDFHGLKNAVKDKAPVHVALDGVEQGSLTAEESMTLRVDSNEHTLSTGALSGKYRIPSGTESYFATFFNGSFRIGPVVDPFRDQLTDFVVNMFRGQGIRERISSKSNYGHNIYLDVHATGIRLHWTLDHNYAKGFKAWLTGEGEEKISYLDINLFPISQDSQPSGYWDFIQAWIESAILNDPQADMQKEGGGFTFRTSHSLY